MKLLLADYEYKMAQLDSIMDEITSLCKKIPTGAGFLSEVSDVGFSNHQGRYKRWPDFSLREKVRESIKMTISERGRSKLRAVLFNTVIPLIAKTPEFRPLHEYYITRANNPLKKKQSVITISCKLIRVFHAIFANSVTYDP